MSKGRISVGGWYQRTTLHLTEVYDFLSRIESSEQLSKKKLQSFHKKLNIKSVERKYGTLEYVHAITHDGIEIKYFEDGLYLLESSNLQSEEKIVTYYEKSFKPAITYLFSLGAPTPKILASMKEKHRVVISKISSTPNTFVVPKKYGVVYSKIKSKNTAVYKTANHIFIVAKPNLKDLLGNLVAMQIFFREFKDQLKKYMHIHRIVWEEIKQLSERDDVKGSELGPYRLKLDSYKKTINFITERMAQMAPYAKTREELANSLNVQHHLLDLFHYRFEDLFDTLTYVQRIWSMTVSYVDSAIKLISDIQAGSTSRSIRSIQVLASIGVIAGFLNYLRIEEIKGITLTGTIYLFVLILIAYLINKGMKKYYKNKQYSITFVPFKKFE